jgi:ATP-dependent Clp protease adaptor protein ClpS
MNATQTQVQTDTKGKPQTKQPWLWNVVLLNDDAHTYDFVIRMMQELFSASPERGQVVAKKVDSQGRAVCLTTHKEHAELKQEQIHSFGRDHLIAGCAGSMTSIIEPAEFGDGDDKPSEKS